MGKGKQAISDTTHAVKLSTVLFFRLLINENIYEDIFTSNSLAGKTFFNVNWEGPFSRIQEETVPANPLFIQVLSWQPGETRGG